MSRKDLCGIAFFCGFFISLLFTSLLFLYFNYKHLLFFSYWSLPFYFRKLAFFALNKIWMLKALLIENISSFVEIVHIKLSNKARKIVVFKIFWKDLVREQIDLFDNETISFIIPRNDFIWKRIANYFICFQKKWGNTWPICFIFLINIHFIR